MNKEKKAPFLKRILRKAKYNYKLLHHISMPKPADISIDIVIPIVEKDLDILPLSLQGIRKNCANRINKIYIVAPSNPVIIDFAKKHDCVFVDELSVMGYGPKTLKLITKGNIDRSGWLFQQFLKLSGKIGEQEWYAVVDADHILLKPHTFVDCSGRHVFYQSAQCHPYYYSSMQRLLGPMELSSLSYVAHKMVFNKKELAKLRREIERKCEKGLTWDMAIRDSLSIESISPFSEFETYGNFIDSDKKICLPWNQVCHHWKDIPDFDSLVKKYGKHYMSVTFPEHKRVM